MPTQQFHSCLWVHTAVTARQRGPPIRRRARTGVSVQGPVIETLTPSSYFWPSGTQWPLSLQSVLPRTLPPFSYPIHFTPAKPFRDHCKPSIRTGGARVRMCVHRRVCVRQHIPPFGTGPDPQGSSQNPALPLGLRCPGSHRAPHAALPSFRPTVPTAAATYIHALREEGPPRPAHSTNTRSIKG